MNVLIYLGILIISMILLYLTNKLLGKLGLTITFIVDSVLELCLLFIGIIFIL